MGTAFPGIEMTPTSPAIASPDDPPLQNVKFITGKIAGHRLQLRVQVADRNPQLRPRRINASGRNLQGKVLPTGLFDQIVEHGVVKRSPPVAIVRLTG
jgi:hypothetical protein